MGDFPGCPTVYCEKSGIMWQGEGCRPSLSLFPSLTPPSESAFTWSGGVLHIQVCLLTKQMMASWFNDVAGKTIKLPQLTESLA